MKRRYDRNGSLLTALDPETDEYFRLPSHDSSIGYGFDQDMDGTVYVAPLLMCPGCGGYRHRHADGLPYRYVCEDCGRTFEYGYPNVNDSQLGSRRYSIVDKATGRILASDLTVEEAKDWVFGYNMSPEGTDETRRIARRFSPAGGSVEDQVSYDIGISESDFISHNQGMPLIDVGESVSFPERRWKLVRSKSKRKAGRRARR